MFPSDCITLYVTVQGIDNNDFTGTDVVNSDYNSQNYLEFFLGANRGGGVVGGIILNRQHPLTGTFCSPSLYTKLNESAKSGAHWVSRATV